MKTDLQPSKEIREERKEVPWKLSLVSEITDNNVSETESDELQADVSEHSQLKALFGS